jgi:hypothetical protein
MCDYSLHLVASRAAKVGARVGGRSKWWCLDRLSLPAPHPIELSPHCELGTGIVEKRSMFCGVRS